MLGEADPYNYDPYYASGGYGAGYGAGYSSSQDQQKLLEEYYASFPQDPECKNCEQRPYIVKGDAGTPGKPGFPGPQGEAVSSFISVTSSFNFI